jgi:assimilatory nitrate reductase catalytic subunit
MFEKWRTPEATFGVLKELSRGRPCDITGIRDYPMIDECGGIQWPWAEHPSQSKPPVERRLFEDGCFFTQDQRARFFFDPPRPLAEPTDSEFPFVLLTGRGTSAQWHTGSRTNKSDVLRGLSPAGCYVEVNPKDAARLGLAPNGLVRVSSRRASLLAVAFVTPTVQTGQVFIPMHDAEVNRLTQPDFDPHSRQPNYKHCAVALEKSDGKIRRNGVSKSTPP